MKTKFLNIKELISLREEAVKLTDCLKRMDDKAKGLKPYKVLLKAMERQDRRIRLVMDREHALKKQNASLDKAEENLLNTVKKSNAGRPKKDDKKIPIGVKLPPWLNDWMNRQPESKAILIETALINYYQIPENIRLS